jgi:hypothetical protein
MLSKVSASRLSFGNSILDEGRSVVVAPDGAETILRPKTLELLRRCGRPVPFHPRWSHYPSCVLCRRRPDWCA